jgi:cytochrome c oxidase subunit 2
MRGTVHVVSQADYDLRPWDVWPDDPLEAGERIYQTNCKSCHNIDGPTLIGPSFRGLFGSTETVELHPNGREANPEIVDVEVTEDFIRESIRTPNVKITVGSTFSYGQMTPFDETWIPDERLPWIIEYIKSLQDGN